MPSWTCEPGRRERIDAFGKRLMSMERTGYEDITRLQKALACRSFLTVADGKPTRRAVIRSLALSAQLTSNHSVAYSAPCSASHCLRCS